MKTPAISAAIFCAVFACQTPAWAIGPLGNDIRVNDPSLDGFANNTTQSETTLAVHGATVCGGFVNTRRGPFPSPLAGVVRSGSWGSSWADLDIANGLQNADPVLAVHKASGRFYYASISALGGPGAGQSVKGIIGVSTSTDDCQTFSQTLANASPSVAALPATTCAPGLPTVCSTNGDCAPGQVCSDADFEDKPWITVDNSDGASNGTVYVCWSKIVGEHPGPSSGFELRFSRSVDGGVSFTDEQVLSAPGDMYPFSCSVAVGPNAEVYVTWATENAGFPIRFRRSLDRGLTWEPVRQVNTSAIRPAGADRIASCDIPRRSLNGDIRMVSGAWMAVDTTGGPYSGNIYLVWQAAPAVPAFDPDDDQSDVHFTRSRDGGVHWDPEVQVSGATPSDQFMPNIAVGGDGTVGIVYYERQNDPNNLEIEVFHTVSRDGGATLDSVQRLSDGSFSVPPINGQLTLSGNFDSGRNACYMGDYIAIAADHDNFYYLWGDNRNTVFTPPYDVGGRPDPDAYFNRIIVPPVVDSVSTNRVWASRGPEGGSITAVAVDPLTPSTVYAATYQAGVFKSTDGGLSWEERNEGLSSPSAKTIAIDPGTGTTAYLGTAGGGVFKTVNGAAAWTSSSSGLADTWVEAVAVDPSNGNVVFAGTSSALYRSLDAAASWSLVATAPGSTSIEAVAVAASDPTVVYAGYYDAGFPQTVVGGVLKSTDGGATWAPVNAGLPGLAGFGVFAVAIDPTDEDTVHVGTNTGIFKTVDGGASWTMTSPSSTLALAINPASPSTVYAASGDILKSVDGGSSWISSGSGISPLRAQVLAIDPMTPSRLYAGTDGDGVYLSVNAASSWSTANSDLDAMHVTDVAVDPEVPQTVYAATGGSGVWKTIDGGTSWAQSGLPGLYVEAIVVDPASPSTVYASSPGVAMYKSTDAGATWTPLAGAPSALTLEIDPGDPQTLYSGDGIGVSKSTDGGASWNPASSGLPSTFVRDLLVLPAGIVFAATDLGVYKSTNGAGTWAAASSGLTTIVIAALAAHPAEPATVYAGSWGGGVFKSTDGGGTWTAINTNLPGSLLVPALVVDPKRSGVVYAGSFGLGVYETTDGGATWSSINDGLTVGLLYRTIEALAIDPMDTRRLYAATFAAGVFSLEPPCGPTAQQSCTGTSAALGSCTLINSGIGLSGSMSFQPGLLDVFGTSVDLASTVGSVSISGTLTGYVGGSGGTSLAMSGTGLGFDVPGTFRAPPTGLGSGDPVIISGPVTNLSGGALPVGPAYRFEAAVRFSPSTSQYTGPCSLNAFLPINTPTGTAVRVVGRTGVASCGQPTTDLPVEVTFSSVDGAGETLIASTCDTGGSVAPNLSLEVASLELFFDISTTASYTAPVEICFFYPPQMAGLATMLHLLHEGTEVPTVVDTVNRKVCGQVTTLSPFALAIDATPATGFVPSDSATRACENKVTSKLGALARRVAACHVKHGNRAFGGHSFDLAACVTKAKAAYEKAIARLSGCPACIESQQAVLRDQVVSAIESATGGAYCSGSQPLGTIPFALVPADRDAKKCAVGMMRQAGKLAKSIGTCRLRAANAAAQNRSFDRAVCESNALSLYDTAMSRLTTCPACDLANQAPVRDQISAFAGSAATALYCDGMSPLP